MKYELKPEQERLKLVRKALYLSQGEFAEGLGMKQGGYCDVERGRNNISKSLYYKLEKAFMINPEWVRTGQGEMLLGDYRKGTTQSKNDALILNIELLMKMNALYEKRIEELEEEISKLQVKKAK